MTQSNELMHDNRTRQDTAQRRSAWRHAFAVDDPADFQPTDQQKEIVDDVCRWMIQRGLTTAALVGIEMHRPGNYLIANIMHFFRPTVSACLPLLHLLPILRRAIPDMKRYRAFAEMLEHRGAADYMVRRMEAIEQESAQRPKAAGDGGDAHVVDAPKR